MPSVVVGSVAWFVLQSQGPLVEGGTINVIGGAAACVLLVCSMTVIADIFWKLGDWFDWLLARTPTGLKGTAGWVKSLKEIKHDLVQKGWGPFWGSLKGQEIIADFISAMVVGPSGSGKSTKIIETNGLALKGFDCVFLDFKSVLTVILADALRKYGNVRIINLGGLFTDLIGEGDKYNPLNLVADCFWNGRLEDLVDLLTEMGLQLYPEPKGGGSKDDNKYFRDGTRRLMAFVIMVVVLIKGYDATLGDVLQMLNDREALLRHALWAAGRLEQEGGEPAEMPIADSPWVEKQDPQDVENFIQYFRAVASGVADMFGSEGSKTAESFIEGAREALQPFNITSRAYKQTTTSTFRFSELKESKRPTKVFIMLDPNKVKSQAPVLGLLQWAMLYELKQHPNKRRKVYLLADEATNIPWSGLGSLLTWARDYGIRIMLVFQTFPAFIEAHGRHTLEIALSECDVKQFLPGQRNPQTLNMLEKMLAHQSIMAANHNSNHKEGGGIASQGFSETGRPLMTADEIRRTDGTITFIRNNKPLLHDSPSIAEIAPWRKMTGINPFYGTRYLLPIKLRLKRRTSLWATLKRWFRRTIS